MVFKVDLPICQIPYARSNEHLSEIVDTVCKNFEDYAQATAKASGEPTIIRFSSVNLDLRFYCLVSG